MEINNLAKQYIYWPELENRYQKNIDLSQVKISNFVNMFENLTKSPQVEVTHSIIRFYTLNEKLARIRQKENEILSVDTLELYKAYNEEVETISKKIFGYIFTICMMELRHCRDFKKFASLKEDTIEHYTFTDLSQEEQEQIQNNYDEEYSKLKAIYFDKYSSQLYENEYGGIEISDRVDTSMDMEKFDIFYGLIEKLHGMGSYSRHHIQEHFIPLLNDPELQDVTIGEMFKFAEKMFNSNNFAGGYGGPAWGNIAKHGLNFVEGKINAEVFVDQAFSLEHNGGQIFNKAIIFENSESNYWKSFNVESPIYDYSSVRIQHSQLILNAQHQGQLLSILKYADKIIPGYVLRENYEQYSKLGWVPKGMEKTNYNAIADGINSNICHLSSIVDSFKDDNKDFIEKLNKFDVEIPDLDFFNLLNHANRTENNGKVYLEEGYRAYHSLASKIAMQINRPEVTLSQISTVDYSFSFEYLNTKYIPEDKFKKEVLGNKALGLAQMNQMELPVPDALVFTTSNAQAFFKEKAKWVKMLRPELSKITQHFTDNSGNPIACSVRSGAPVSMPGMMDTILNVGIDDSNYDYFCQKMGKKVTNECVVKFMSLFTKSLFNEEVKYSDHLPKALYQFREVLNRHNIAQNYTTQFPLNARQQYKWCLEAVFGSWHSERATAYRNHQGISHDIGTAAIVQQMVFGNLNDQSCTGVVFSRDCISGEKGVIGEFLPKAQGEDVVSGAVTPKNIKELKDFNPIVYDELIAICERLEKDTGDIQDIEFTVEDSKLYILQKRKAVCSSLAQTKLNQELFETGLISEEKMLNDIQIDSLITKDVVDASGVKEELKGLIGNPGIMRGVVIRSEVDMSKYAQVFEENKRDENFGWIFYAPETSPDHAPIMLKTQAFITSNGGFTSHAAIISRSWDKPCIVGIGHEDSPLLESGSVITLDANNGKIYKDILPLKEGSELEVQNMVNRILAYHKVNIDQLASNNPFQKVISDINSKPTWMEELPNVKLVENKTPRVRKFLDLGQKVALMLVKANESAKVAIKAKLESKVEEQDFAPSINTTENAQKNDKQIISEVTTSELKFPLKGKLQNIHDIKNNFDPYTSDIYPDDDIKIRTYYDQFSGEIISSSKNIKNRLKF